MCERDKLIIRLQELYRIHNEKCKNHNQKPEVGSLTREAFEIASLLPEMMRLNIKLEDLSS